MMAIISDIHGNLPALEAVLEDIKKYSCKTIYSLGDVSGYYCMINECVQLLRDYNVISIMGNHDKYLISGKRCPRSNSANLCLDYQKKKIYNNNYKWLQGLSPYIDKDNMSMRHGGWNNYLDEYINEFSFDIELINRFDIFLSGHTHIPKEQHYMGKVYCNPGSVGQPRDGDKRAAYAVINNKNKICLHRVEYDIDKICFEMKKNGFSKRIYENLHYGLKIGDEQSVK